MPNRLTARRALLEAILSDPWSSHTDRLRADERLAELETQEVRHVPSDRLQPGTPEYWRELEAFGMPAAIAVALGPDARSNRHTSKPTPRT
jgi:DsbC/DsbD-like thiol-disulfide interchange protein